MTKISLSTLLRRIAAEKQKLSSIDRKIPASNIYKNKDDLSYELPELLLQRNQATQTLIKYKTILQKANCENQISYHDTLDQGSATKTIYLSEAIFLLQELKSEIALLNQINVLAKNEVTQQQQVYNNGKYETTTCKSFCFITERERDKRVELLKEQFAAINAAIEAANNLIVISLE